MANINQRSNFLWESTASIFESSFSVVFPKSPNLDLILISSILEQDIYMHERLELQFKGRPFNKEDVIVSGDPVTFTYSSGKIKSTFKGYVSYIDQANKMSGSNTTVVCVGASYVLKNTDQKIYTKMTADQVINKIAAKHGFSCTTQKHPRLRDAVVQSGQTDWQVCTSLAKQTGFALIVENTHITFVSKDKIYNAKKANAPYYVYVDNNITGIATHQDRYSGTAFYFKPIIADLSPESGAVVDRVFNGTSASTGSAINVTHPLTGAVNTNTGSVIPSKEYFE
jgi:hypothetical protein